MRVLHGVFREYKGCSGRFGKTSRSGPRGRKRLPWGSRGRSNNLDVSPERGEGVERVYAQDAVAFTIRLAGINTRHMETDPLIASVRGHTGGLGAGLVVEVAGKGSVIEQGVGMLRTGGRYWG